MRVLLLKCMMLLLLLGCSLTLQGQTRRALVIGLGEQLDTNWSKINGDKDVYYVTKMLQKCGYKDIKTLVNKQATKSKIVSAFKSLSSRCEAGDVVYIHYSGHGQQVTDVNGDEDNWDESWVPYDAYLKYCKKDRGEKHLIDDEVYKLLMSIRNEIGPKGKLLVVVDSCHSGDSSREAPRKTSSENDSIFFRGALNRFVIPVVKKTKTRRMTERWLILSACKSGQLNQEFVKPQVGRLTYILYLLIEQGHVNMERIEKMMQKYPTERTQTPLLTGEKELYNISDVLR